MPGDKARLYVALYARAGAPKMPDKEDKYHWAFLVGPKNESNNASGTRFYAKNAPGQSTWIFEEKATTMTATNMILVRILIGKINDPTALAARLRQIPVNNSESDWNCVHWLQSALASISKDTTLMGTSMLDWDTVKAAVMQYCERKVAQGRFKGESNVDLSKVPTFDLLQGKETVK